MEAVWGCHAGESRCCPCCQSFLPLLHAKNCDYCMLRGTCSDESCGAWAQLFMDVVTTPLYLSRTMSVSILI